MSQIDKLILSIDQARVHLYS